MDLPSSRELELETFLRQRDAQLAELTDEVAHLRRYLSHQPTPSLGETVALPPAFASLILPYIHSAQSQTLAGSSIESSGAKASSSTVASLTQRVQLLQEENDELYGLLRTSETGKLKEETKVLNRVVGRLERALTESHVVIQSLSDELAKAHEATLAAARHINQQPHHPLNSRKHSRSPSASRVPHNGAVLAPGDKPLPTGPRAHKKPRLSSPSSAHINRDSNARSGGPVATSLAPPAQGAPSGLVNSRHNSNTTNGGGVVAGTKRRERSPPPHQDATRRRIDRERETADVKKRAATGSGERDRARDRDRERDRERDRGRDRARDRGRGDRDREREREKPNEDEKDITRERHPRSAESPRGSGRRSAPGDVESGLSHSLSQGSSASADRTLAQRMGL